jgi:hypothetical protein
LPRLDRGTSALPVTTFQTAQDVETYPEASQARCRASVIFAAPEEITKMIEAGC